MPTSPGTEGVTLTKPELEKLISDAKAKGGITSLDLDKMIADAKARARVVEETSPPGTTAIPNGGNERFDRRFFVHLAISLVVFGVSIGCLAWQIPGLNSPLMVIAGPIVTLWLAWQHRPRRLT